MEKTYLALIAVVVVLAVAVALLAPTGDHETPKKTTPAPATSQPPATTAPPQTTQPPETTSPPQTTQPPETQQPNIELPSERSICDLVKIASVRGWRYEDSNGTWFEFSYSVKGRENVGGVQALKVEITAEGSDAEEEVGYLWLDTTACRVVQLQLPDGTLLTGVLAEQAAAPILQSLLVPILTSEGIASEVLAAEQAGWQVSWSDLGARSVAGRSMHVMRFVAHPLPGSEDYGQVSKVTVEVGDLGGGLWMVVYVKQELPNGGWMALKVTKL